MASNDMEGSGGGFYDLRWQRNQDEEEERKRREAEQRAAEANQSPVLAYTPPESEEGAQQNQWDEDEEDEQPIQSEENSDVNLFDLLKPEETEEEETPATVAEAAENVEPSVIEPEDEKPKAEEKEEEPLVYVPKDNSGGQSGNSMNAADTKGLLTEEDEDWLSENHWAAGRRNKGKPIEANSADETPEYKNPNGASARRDRNSFLDAAKMLADPFSGNEIPMTGQPAGTGGRSGPTKDAERNLPELREPGTSIEANAAGDSPVYENPNGASSRYDAANNYRNGDAGNQRYVYRGNPPVQEPEMLFPEDFGGNSAVPPENYTPVSDRNMNPDYEAARERQARRDAERAERMPEILFPEDFGGNSAVPPENYSNDVTGMTDTERMRHDPGYSYVPPVSNPANTRGYDRAEERMPEGDFQPKRESYEDNPQYQTDLALGLVDESFSPETLEKMYGEWNRDPDYEAARQRQTRRDAERAERESVDAYSRAYQEVIENGGSDREAEIAGTRAVEAADNSDPIGDWFRDNQENNDAYNNAYGDAYAAAISNGLSEREAEAAAMEAGKQAAENTANRMTDTERMRHDPGYSYVPPALTEAQRRFEQEEATGLWRTNVPQDDRGITWNPDPDYEAARQRQSEREKADKGRVGAENALPEVMGEGTQGNTQQPNTAPKNGTDTTPKSEVDSTGRNNSGKYENVPAGSQYLTPSYGQGGQVVKAPYRKGGYTAEELKAMGNHAYGMKYGSELYEGYYKAPNGKYYPVDQVKANYWRQNGGSYQGWEEGMRDYWNTFGTFYGYRPGWQSAGRVGGGGGYSYGGGGGGGSSSKSSSKSSSGSSSGKNYGSGSSVNNGLYWNGNSRWNI